jgi:hypothetical protein
VRVRVAPVRGRTTRQRAVRVTLVRLGDDGRPLRTVASRKVRRGTFRVRLPRGDGARYVLSVRAGRRTLRERLATARRAPRTRAPPPATPAPPAPAPPSQPAPVCQAAPGARLAGTLAFDRPSAWDGETVRITTSNTGQLCLGGGYGYTWERLVEGAWTPVRVAPSVVPAVYLSVAPGASLTEHATIENPVTMPPGRYRVAKRWQANTLAGSSTEREVVLHAYLDVLPGPNGGPAPDRCGSPDAAAAATGALDRTIAPRGEALTLTVSNTGPVCLMGSDTGYRLERYLGDGTTEPVIPLVAYGPDRAVVYQPGDAHAIRILVENVVAMPAGRYRVSYDLWVPPTSDEVVVRTVQADFDV